MHGVVRLVLKLARTFQEIHHVPLGEAPDHAEPCQVLVVFQVIVKTLWRSNTEHFHVLIK